MQKVWFVIVIYHPQKEFEDLLYQLSDYSIVIVDNTEVKTNLHPKTKPQIKKLFIRPKNIGYAAGANLGIKYALSKNAGWIILLNQDLVIRRKEIVKFCGLLQQAPQGLCGPFPGFLDPKRWTTILPKGINDNKSKGIDYISGSFLAVAKEVVEKTGLFEEKYFMYYEDAEYSVTAKKYGFSLTYLPIKLTHNESSVIGNNSFLHQYYLARNHLIFVFSHAPRLVKLYETLRLPKTIFGHYKNKERGALIGIWHYFLGRFGKYADQLFHW